MDGPQKNDPQMKAIWRAQDSAGIKAAAESALGNSHASLDSAIGFALEGVAGWGGHAQSKHGDRGTERPNAAIVAKALRVCRKRFVNIAFARRCCAASG